MKNNKGFAPIVVIAIVVLVGGAVYALLPRNVLKSFFETGDKPTEQQFSDTIDSSLNLQDDGLSTESKVSSPTKKYEVGDTAVKSDSIYQAKVLSETQTEFKLNSAQTVTFRWTPIVPKPQEPTTYRLKVWQLMQGQNSSQAMKTNQPIVTKEVVNTTEVTVSGIYTGPCKPPYLCDFVWSVEAVSVKAGTGESTTPATTGVTPPTESDGSSTGTR
jgi:hypothetical protein